MRTCIFDPQQSLAVRDSRHATLGLRQDHEMRKEKRCVTRVHKNRYLTSFADNLNLYTSKSSLAYVPTLAELLGLVIAPSSKRERSPSDEI